VPLPRLLLLLTQYFDHDRQDDHYDFESGYHYAPPWLGVVWLHDTGQSPQRRRQRRKICSELALSSHRQPRDQARIGNSILGEMVGPSSFLASIHEATAAIKSTNRAKIIKPAITTQPATCLASFALCSIKNLRGTACFSWQWDRSCLCDGLATHEALSVPEHRQIYYRNILQRGFPVSVKSI